MHIFVIVVVWVLVCASMVGLQQCRVSPYEWDTCCSSHLKGTLHGCISLQIISC